MPSLISRSRAALRDTNASAVSASIASIIFRFLSAFVTRHLPSGPHQPAWHTAPHCIYITLQNTAEHCKTLQNAAERCRTLQNALPTGDGGKASTDQAAGWHAARNTKTGAGAHAPTPVASRNSEPGDHIAASLAITSSEMSKLVKTFCTSSSSSSTPISFISVVAFSSSTGTVFCGRQFGLIDEA